MKIAGQVISLPLFMETFAFFFEAIFLGIYLYTWDRFKNKMYHWVLSIPIIIGSSASAFFITTVNAFMNTPQGFKLENGVITHIEPLVAMFNPATPTKVLHVLTSAYLTSACVLAAITAWAMLKGKRDEYYKKALKLTMTATFIFAVLTAVVGDLSAKFLANYQPEKLAAAEWHFETEKDADLILFGYLDENNEVKKAIRIPKALSFLAHGDVNAEVIGLNEFPKDEIPPLWVHYMFDLMVVIGFYTVFVSLLYIIFMTSKRWNEHNKWLLWAIVAGGPLSMLAIEFGWIFAEVGRQPWILRGYMKVSEGATTSEHVGLMFILFLVLYIVLAWICTSVLLRMFRKNPPEQELQYRFHQ
jgi:cytochrome bd ubiquinol oxidase subunit I